MSSQAHLDLDKFRALLESERERLMRVIHPGPDEPMGNDQAEATSDLSDYPDHPADQGTETYEREKDMALRENARDLLEGVEDALRKMESGTYGICSSCDKPIPEGRLLAMPSAIYCVPCQSKLEGL